jgi:hypothetical protein
MEEGYYKWFITCNKIRSSKWFNFGIIEAEMADKFKDNPSDISNKKAYSLQTGYNR